MINTDVIKYTTAERLADEYQKRVPEIIRHMENLKSELDALSDAFSEVSQYSDFRVYVNCGYGGNARQLDDFAIEEFKFVFKQRAWKMLISKMGVSKLMTEKQRKDLESALHGHDRKAKELVNNMPDITADNILSVANGYVDSAQKMLNEKVAEVYQQIVPRSRTYGASCLKANKLDRINEKIVLGGIVEQGFGNPYRLNYHRALLISDLDLIMHLLDGQGISKEHYGELGSAILASEDGKGETKYFKFKCFKNGNLHLWFLRKDLLDQMNQIACNGSKNVGAAMA